MSHRRNEAAIVQLMIALIRKLDLTAAARRDLLDNLIATGEAALPCGGQGDSGTPARTLTVREIPLSQFTGMPYLDVARRRVLDGEKGAALPIQASDDFFPSGTADVFSELLQKRKVHKMEVVAHVISSSTYSSNWCRTRAEGLISKVKRSIRNCGIAIDKVDGRRGSWYAAKRDPEAGVVFSIDRAIEISQRAALLLADGRFDAAAATTIEAIRVDGTVQQAHEVLLAAATSIGCAGFIAVSQLGRSVKRLVRRAEHLPRCLKIIDNALAEAAGEDPQDLQTVRDAMQAELEHINTLVAGVQSAFGPVPGRSPESAKADELLDQLRKLHLGVDRSLQNPFGQRLLGYSGVEKLRNLAMKGLPLTASGADRQAERTWANAVFMMVALAPGANLDIRAVCKTAKFEIAEAQNPTDGDRSIEARWSRQWNRAKELLLAINGPGVSDEEVAALLQWSWARVKALRDWQKLRYADGSDRLDEYVKQSDDDPYEDEENGRRRNGRVKNDGETSEQDPE